MQSSPAEIISLTIAITTLFLLLVGSFAIRYIFLYQKKRFRHRQEVIDMRETFGRTLLQSKLEIQEQTLDHIAKELHANIGQTVSYLQIGAEELSIQTEGKQKENALVLFGLAGQLIAELKAISGSLNTDHIMHIGFVPALNNELTRLGNTKKYQITFSKTGLEFRLRPEDEIILFRLCQEVLNNIVNHAAAKSITINIDYSQQGFILEVKDDGKGFVVADALDENNNKISTGLLNIKKRAKLINAEVAIESSAGAGTKFIIRIPQPSSINMI